MAKLIATSLRRTGNSASKFRQIVVVRENGEEAVLSTAIEKVTLPPAFRHGGSARPVEQYYFVVKGRAVERFADATAIVMKIHHIEVTGDPEGHQEYVQRAMAIVAGREELRPASAINLGPEKQAA